MDHILNPIEFLTVKFYLNNLFFFFHGFNTFIFCVLVSDIQDKMKEQMNLTERVSLKLAIVEEVRNQVSASMRELQEKIAHARQIANDVSYSTC